MPCLKQLAGVDTADHPGPSTRIRTSHLPTSIAAHVPVKRNEAQRHDPKPDHSRSPSGTTLGSGSGARGPRCERYRRQHRRALLPRRVGGLSCRCGSWPDAELARLSAWPAEIAPDDLVMSSSLPPMTMWRGCAPLTGWRTSSVSPCSCPHCRGWGWVPDELADCPAAAVARLAAGLAVDPAVAGELLAGVWRLAGPDTSGSSGAGARTARLAHGRCRGTQAARRLPACPGGQMLAHGQLWVLRPQHVELRGRETVGVEAAL